jgi:DNA gyrase/topoisomerase IV subunit A
MKRRLLQEPAEPKKPVVAYFQFTNKERQKDEYRELGLVEMTRRLGQKWLSMTPEEKEPYNILAKKDVKRYNKDLKESEKRWKEYREKLKEQHDQEHKERICKIYRRNQNQSKSYYRVYVRCDYDNGDDEEEDLITEDICEVMNALQYEAERLERDQDDDDEDEDTYKHFSDNNDCIIKILLDNYEDFGINIMEFKRGISRDLAFEIIFQRYLSKLILDKQQERKKCFMLKYGNDLIPKISEYL